MKQKLFWIGLTAVILSYVGNYLYFLSKQLDEPLFLEHYYYRNYEPNLNVDFEFYYLTNKTKPLTISHVEIDGVDARVQYSRGLFGWTNDSQVHYYNQYTHHYLMNVWISISTEPHSLLLEENETWSFEEMIVYFSNGESQTVHIGEVTISNPSIDYRHSDSLIYFHSSRSSPNYLERFGEVKKNLTIEKIDSTYWDLLKDHVKIKINSPAITDALNDTSENENDDGVTYSGIEVTDEFSPIHLHAKEQIHLTTQIHDLKSILEVPLKIIGTTEDGEPFELFTWVHHRPNFDQKTIDKMIQSLKVGEEIE